MKNELKRKDLVLIKWNSKYITDRNGCSLTEDVKFLDRDIETSTVGYFIEEDDNTIVLAQSIYGYTEPLCRPNVLCKNCMVIPKFAIMEVSLLSH